jgi:nucleotide-binding universal stress UspA family protein
MAEFIVGVDGSAGGAAALRWAARLASAAGVGLVAINAYHRPFAEIPPDDFEEDLTARGVRLAEEWVKPAVDMGVAVRTIVHEGDARTMLDDADRDAALVVLGRSGHGTEPGLFHVGSVVEHVAHHASVPLAVVQPEGATTVDQIVLGLDGSRESDAAVRWVAQYAPALHADVLAVHVDERASRRSGSAEQRALAEDTIRRWAEPISAAGVGVTPLDVCDLHPADALVGAAARKPDSLLVIGTRGTGGFTGLRIGGVAMKVLHRATRDLVLVPPDGKD